MMSITHTVLFYSCFLCGRITGTVHLFDSAVPGNGAAKCMCILLYTYILNLMPVHFPLDPSLPLPQAEYRDHDKVATSLEVAQAELVKLRATLSLAREGQEIERSRFEQESRRVTTLEEKLEASEDRRKLQEEQILLARKQVGCYILRAKAVMVECLQSKVVHILHFGTQGKIRQVSFLVLLSFARASSAVDRWNNCSWFLLTIFGCPR